MTTALEDARKALCNQAVADYAIRYLLLLYEVALGEDGLPYCCDGDTEIRGAHAFTCPLHRLITTGLRIDRSKRAEVRQETNRALERDL